MTVQDGLEATAEWPPLLTREAGRMVLDGCDLDALAARYGTPLWVLSLRAAGAAPGSIILNGNGKSDAALTLAARMGVRQVNLDSMGELRRLERVAAACGTMVDCAVRVRLGYRSLLELDPSFEPMLNLWEGKFGVSVATGEAARVVEAVLRSPRLHFVGLHHHVGFSAVAGSYEPELDVGHHREAARELCGFAAGLGVRLERLNLGGGFPSAAAIGVQSADSGHTKVHEPAPLREYAEAIAAVMRASFAADELPVLQFETGRFQVQNAGIFLTRVTDVKRRHGDPPRTVITVDGSMQQCTQLGFGRTRSTPVVLGRDGAGDGEISDVVGQTCVYDALAEGIALPPVRPGDLIVLPNHGAYTDVSGTNLNAMPRPACAVVDRGRAALAKRREDLSDILARHTGRPLDRTPLDGAPLDRAPLDRAPDKPHGWALDWALDWEPA